MKSIKKGVYKIDGNHEFLDVISNQLFIIHKTKKTIHFKAETVQTLKEFFKIKKKLSYKLLLNFVFNTANLLESLEKKKLSIPFFSMSDFSVIDSKYFLYTNQSKIIPIKQKLITIDTPYKDHQFISPELENITTLPSTISHKSGLFSLASMAGFLLTHRDITQEMIEKGLFWKTLTTPVGQGPNDLAYETLLLETIFNTKLYWALERCLYNDPEKRIYFYI